MIYFDKVKDFVRNKYVIKSSLIGGVTIWI